MSIFGNIQNAPMSQGGPKLPENFSGILEVVGISFDLKAFHGAVYIVEMVVHETNQPAEAPIGFRPSWTANMKHANTLGNIKSFLGACFGLDPRTQEAQINAGVTEAFTEATIGPAQPVRGKFVACSTEVHKTQKNFDFIKHFWAPTTKTFPSRINDQGVTPAASSAPAAPAMAMPTMPGAFNPQGFAPPAPSATAFPAAAGGSFPAAPSASAQGFPWSPPAAPSTASSPFGVPTVPMTSMAPSAAAPAFPPASIPQLPQMPGMGIPAGLPPLPQMAPAPFPPPGWKAHPQAPGWFYLEQNPAQMKTEADLRAGR